MKFFDKRIISKFDFLLLLFILPIILISYQLINEVNPRLGLLHLEHIIGAFVIFIGCVFIPVRKFILLIPILYWLGIILLICVEFYGITKLGAKRWLFIPFFDTTIQPSELFKVPFLLMMGYLINRKPPKIDGYGFKDFVYFSFFILLPFFLIAKEPDLGTAVILLLVGYSILFIIGVNLKIWIIIGIITALISPVVYSYLIKDYQKKRIEDFLSKEPSYHVQQSVIAIGSGGLFGKNKEDATQTNLQFLPIATSDFIFAYFVERYGFVGAFFLILLYILLILHILSMNYYHDDYLIKVISSGIAFLLFFNMSVNILMVIGYAPVVGLPLPLFSYGGTSIIMFFILFGILQNLIIFRISNLYEFNRKISI